MEPIVRAWTPVAGDPLWPLKLQRAKRQRSVYLTEDVFRRTVPFRGVDVLFAVMASLLRHTFVVTTDNPARMREYFERVRQGGPQALAAYEATPLPARGFHKIRPPTPELRFIYDSAVRALRVPEGPPHWGAFPGREYHWRKWPLDNVTIIGGEA